MILHFLILTDKIRSLYYRFHGSLYFHINYTINMYLVVGLFDVYILSTKFVPQGQSL